MERTEKRAETWMLNATTEDRGAEGVPRWSWGECQRNRRGNISDLWGIQHHEGQLKMRLKFDLADCMSKWWVNGGGRGRLIGVGNWCFVFDQWVWGLWDIQVEPVSIWEPGGKKKKVLILMWKIRQNNILDVKVVCWDAAIAFFTFSGIL